MTNPAQAPTATPAQQHYVGNWGMAYCGTFFGVQLGYGLGVATTTITDQVTCGKCRAALALPTPS